jgi:cytochrome c oxidase assembly factor CtaG
VSHPAAALDVLVPEAVALAWSFEPMVVVPVVAAAALYLRGWAALRPRMPARFGAGRAAAFAAGLGVVLVAVCSPIDALGHRLLQAHMIQHLLLMVVAPPLLWLGAPVAPLLGGLPVRARRAVASVLATRPARRLTGVLTEPRVAWVSFVVAFWAWHAPALYDLALRSDLWHHVEHACFFLTALLFWHPVILPWPARQAWPRWGMIVYLLLAEAQATLLSAILTFSDRVIYPAYAAGAGLRGLSPLDDQALAGVIMWVPGSIAFTVPMLWLVLQALGPQPRMPARAAPATTTVTATNGSTATNAGQRS